MVGWPSAEPEKPCCLSSLICVACELRRHWSDMQIAHKYEARSGRSGWRRALSPLNTSLTPRTISWRDVLRNVPDLVPASAEARSLGTTGLPVRMSEWSGDPMSGYSSFVLSRTAVMTRWFSDSAGVRAKTGSARPRDSASAKRMWDYREICAWQKGKAVYNTLLVAKPHETTWMPCGIVTVRLSSSQLVSAARQIGLWQSGWQAKR